MANILPENETTTFEEQVYVNPETSLNEQTSFIDNLRANQQQNNAQIQQQTHDLGTDVPSNLGGLVGGEGYFTSRYQTPQTNSLVADLRATAQAQALSQVLENQQAMWKNRYNEAYRAAQKRARAAAKGGNGGGDTTGGGLDDSHNTVGEIDAPGGMTITQEDIDKYGPGGMYVEGSSPGTIDVVDANGVHHVMDKNPPTPGAGNTEHYNKLKRGEFETGWDWLEGLFQGIGPVGEPFANFWNNINNTPEVSAQPVPKGVL